MQSQPQNPPDANPTAWLQKKLALEASMRNGIGWFYWIGGMSIINTVIFLLEGSLTFVIGLGATQLVDGLAARLADGASADTATILRGVGFVLDIAIAGVFIAAGFLGLKRYRWAIIAGMLLYAFDSLIFIIFQSWLGLAFHAFAMWGLWRGLQSLNGLKKMEQTAPAAMPAFPQTPLITEPQPRNWFRALGVVVLGFLAFVVVMVVVTLLVTSK